MSVPFILSSDTLSSQEVGSTERCSSLPSSLVLTCPKLLSPLRANPGWTGWLSSGGKGSTRQCRRPKGLKFDSWVGKIPWRRKWLPTPVFLPGKSHRQRSVAGYSPWDLKESDMTEHTHTHAHTSRWKLYSLKSLLHKKNPFPSGFHIRNLLSL